jgi:hypothetical protein
MAEKKMTRKEALENAIAITKDYLNSDMWDFSAEQVEETIEVLTKMHEQLTKPRKRSDAPTKTQIMNANLAEKCFEAISEKGEPVTTKWITEHVAGIMTPQKCTAVMKLLVADGRVTKAKDGKAVTYEIAE